MEMTASLAVLRRGYSAVEAGEGSAKKIRTEKAAAKKTKKVMKTVSKEQVELVLAAKPKVRWNKRAPETQPTARLRETQPRWISEERRRQSAWVDEVVRCNNEIVRGLQEDYRQQLATKGFVQVEVEVTDDES